MPISREQTPFFYFDSSNGSPVATPYSPIEDTWDLDLPAPPTTSYSNLPTGEICVACHRRIPLVMEFTIEGHVFCIDCFADNGMTEKILYPCGRPKSPGTIEWEREEARRPISPCTIASDDSNLNPDAMESLPVIRRADLRPSGLTLHYAPDLVPRSRSRYNKVTHLSNDLLQATTWPVQGIYEAPLGLTDPTDMHNAIAAEISRLQYNNRQLRLLENDRILSLLRIGELLEAYPRQEMDIIAEAGHVDWDTAADVAKIARHVSGMLRNVNPELIYSLRDAAAEDFLELSNRTASTLQRAIETLAVDVAEVAILREKL
jgi:hypothetical protein